MASNVEPSPQPFLSIVIPCYNQAHYLIQAVDSIANQEFKNWELIIVDDGSTDDTAIVGGDFAKQDPRVRFVKKENGGLSSARNAGMKVAGGDYLQFLDADDFFVGGGMDAVYRAVLQNGNPDILRTGYNYVFETDSRVIQTIHREEISDPIPFVFSHNLGPCHSIFIRRELAALLGSFDETLSSAEDWDFWIRAVKAGAHIKALREPVVVYRYVSNSMSRNAFRMYEALNKVALRAYLKDSRIQLDSALNKDYDFDPSPGIKNLLLTCLGVSVAQGKIDESVQLFEKETRKYLWNIESPDFAAMCSYLSFRYLNGKEDVHRIFSEVVPRFEAFFGKLHLSPKQQKSALLAVFHFHYKRRNQFRLGKGIGKLVNWVLY